MRLIGTNETLTIKKVGGAASSDITLQKLDKNANVIAIDLETQLELYRGAGGALDRN